MARHATSALPRLYVEQALIGGENVVLGKAQAHYLTGVLRRAPGDAVLLFNGRDGEWLAVLQAARGGATLSCERLTRPQIAAPDVWLAFAPLKSARLDYMVQKAAEMGASTLQPVITRRTVATQVRLERMRANVIEAAEQCGLVAVPEVRAPVDLGRLLASWPANRALIFADEAAAVRSPLAALAGLAGRPLGVLVGPEGGFEPAERAAIAAHAAACPISLGPRIMRADTAAVAALAVVHAAAGDWSPLAEQRTKEA